MNYDFENKQATQTTQATQAKEIDKGYALDWDSEISGGEFKLLPAGTYEFIAVSVERGRFEGSEKLNACPKTIVTFYINNGNDTVTIKHNFLLHSKFEWQLSQFFSAIGHKKPNEKLKMNWNIVPGSKGHCVVNIIQSDNGKEFNRIVKFVE